MVFYLMLSFEDKGLKSGTEQDFFQVLEAQECRIFTTLLRHQSLAETCCSVN